VPPFLNSDVRVYLYGILTAALPLLVAYGIIGKNDLPLWIALSAAIVGQATPAAALIAQRRTGQVEPKRARKPSTGA
jgi:hypothetical protein